MTPRIMGILNVTPDSFSDGGRHDTTEAAIAAGMAMHAAGADYIDVGGESTRPGADPVPLAEELRRTIPVVEALAGAGISVSIDTMKAEVMRRATAAGATIVNDVSALQADPESLMAASESGVRIILVHMAGDPRTMQDAPRYADAPAEIFASLAERIAACERAGIPSDRLIADPGIGFGKTLAHNLEILRKLERFHALGVEIMLAASRKSIIAEIVGPTPPDARLPGSLALALRAADAGAQWVRVHDVAATVQALRVWQAIGAQGEAASQPGAR